MIQMSMLLSLQWGRNLIVAEGRARYRRRARRATLQWGRNLIVAEGSQVCGWPSLVRASMGPQLDSCGRLPLYAGVGAPDGGFNGAAT